MPKGTVYLKRTAAILLLAVCVMAGLELTDSLLRTHSEEPQANLPAGSVDVAFIGSSHQYCAIIPQLLMDEYGIAANGYSYGYLMGENALSMLRLVLKNQRPAVAVFDLFSFMAPYTYTQDMNGDATDVKNETYRISYQRLANSLSWFSPEKYQVLAANWRTAPETMAYASLTYAAHQRLLESDFRVLNGKRSQLRKLRFSYELSLAAQDQSAWETPVEPDGNARLYQPYGAVLEQIVSLLQENGVQPVFTLLPYRWSAQEMQVYQEIERRFANRGVLFVGMEEILAGAGIDAATDYQDIAHLNYRGAGKATRYLGGLLQAGGLLTDRRGESDALHEAWRLRPYSYLADEAAALLPETSDYPTYLRLLQQLNQDYVLLVDAPCLLNGEVDLWAGLAAATGSEGFDPNRAQFLMLRGGEALYREEYTGEFQYDSYLENNGYHVECLHNVKVDMRIDDQQVNSADGGGLVTVVVYNLLTETLADSVTFGYDGEKPVVLRNALTAS